jgi:hypothetical protein
MIVAEVGREQEACVGLTDRDPSRFLRGRTKWLIAARQKTIASSVV